VWSILFLHDNPTPAGILGLVILVGGLMVVGSSAWWSQRQQKIPVQRRSVLLAGGVALCISIYSVIDGAAVKRFEASTYAAVVFWLTALLIMPFAIWRFGWPAAKSVWQRNYVRITSIGLLSLLAYWLVLNAYAIAPVSYAGAMREMSVVFGALVGWLLLKEGFGAVRAFGSVIIFAGILIVAVAG
jgi:drug/metabolite transporter (DMT)-like permease